MKIELNRVDKDYHFQGIGTAGIPVNIDASERTGGHNSGARPMELILMGLGSCSAIDIVSILKKQKQKLDDFKIVIDGERDNLKTPSIFTNINIHFKLYGNLDADKVSRAVDLSMTKYCSVSAMLDKTAKITYTFSIND